MPSKQKAPVVQRVHCRDCRHASAFIENSCYCSAMGRRTCACERYGRVCKYFENINLRR